MNKEVSGDLADQKSSAFELVRSDPDDADPGSAQVSADHAGRNRIFSGLVEGDTDIAGLVAYSIYKQNKLDWLAAFETAKARAPNEAELASYIIGEGTPRRLSTYRQLADATLAGDRALDGRADPRAKGTERSGATPMVIATYAIVAFLFAIGFWLATHFTMGR